MESTLLFIAVLLILGIFWAVSTHNHLVKLNNLVTESWRQVDVELARRHDLIPNLVEVVSGYARHEAALFADLTATRTQALAARTPGQLSAPETALGASVGRVLAVAEAYPELKSASNFLQLQYELVRCEDRIAAGRRFYNGNVRTFNTKIDSFPASLLASGYSHGEYFMLDSPAAAQPIAIQLSPPPQAK
ncbi:MAG: LemA family protein [Propionibacteriaceae bacterium]|jgi:LemA protein|nr:LemA family protein [Propionibacteriaceae bacterium]